jgi:hypothetical protein
VLRLLERYPTATLLAQACRQDLLAVARASKHRQPQRLADKVADALAADHFTPRAYLARAKADTIRLAATQLLGLATQRRVWERRMGTLLLGATRARPGVALGGEVLASVETRA